MKDSVNRAKICPKCQFKNGNDAIFCHNCGNEIIPKVDKFKSYFKDFVSILDFSSVIKGLIVVSAIVILYKQIFI